MKTHLLKIDGMTTLELKLLWCVLGALSGYILVNAAVNDPGKLIKEAPLALLGILGFGFIITLFLKGSSWFLAEKIYFDGSTFHVGQLNSGRIFVPGDIIGVRRTAWKKPYINEIQLQNGERIQFGVPIWLIEANDRDSFISKVRAKHGKEFGKASSTAE